MSTPGLKFELALAALLFCFGLTLLPVSIYWVGSFVVGPYADEAGIMGLLDSIWTGLGQGQPVAWALVLSPYVVVQLARLSRSLWRVPRESRGRAKAQ
jgi:hypothetical protein